MPDGSSGPMVVGDGRQRSRPCRRGSVIDVPLELAKAGTQRMSFFSLIEEGDECTVTLVWLLYRRFEISFYEQVFVEIWGN